MQKQTGAILLIAGTCIGSGMIALPMVLAKLGILFSVIIMVLTWGLAYYTSLVSVELNLHADRGLSLGAMGKTFSGRYAEIIGNFSVKLLCYALLSVYIYGESSVIEKLLEAHSILCSPMIISTILAIGTVLVLQLPIHMLNKINGALFLALICVFIIPLFAIMFSIDVSKMPLIVDPSCGNIASVISVVFTSFGFQVIFHTLRDYLGKDAKMLKKSFLYGSMLPVILYTLWTCGVLSVLHSSNEAFHQRMVVGNVEVGELISELSKISGLLQFQIFVWWLSIFAILTSILGVGIGLVGSFDAILEKAIPTVCKRKIVSALITIVPSYLVAITVPNAFIKVFRFAGAILAVIAILLPMYLLHKAKFKKLYYQELGNKLLVTLSILFGMAVILIELFGI
jgi:tyrosine-specific transport protein